jgi:alpha-glucosidase (family GH31 glycosyl hydrolase)
MTRRRFLRLGSAGVAGAGLGGGWLASVVGASLGGCGDNDAAPAVRITVLDEDVVRVQLAPADAPWPADGPEVVIVTPDDAWPNPAPAIATADVVATSQLRIERTTAPFRLRITAADGAPMLDDVEIDRGCRRASWRLAADEHIFGFGDQRAPLDKRGAQFAVRSSDSDFHAGDPFATYKAVPLLLSTRGYGLYVHTTWRSQWSFDPGRGRSQVELDGGHLDFYVFAARSFATIAERYTRLTGRPALLPRWAFGFHQGGANNDQSEAWADGIGAAMRAADLPIDVVYYDDWDPATFTPELVQRMWDEHHIKITAGLGLSLTEVDSPLWSQLAALEPPGLIAGGDGAIARYTGYGFSDPFTEVDFFAPAAVDAMFAGVWQGPIDAGVFPGMLDFGELSFVPQPATSYFPSFGSPRRTVDELRNVYGVAYGEGLVTRAARRVGSRLIGMTRAGGAGSQRFGWTWTADSTPAWSDPGGLGGLREHLRAVLGLAMSGFSTVGFDIGGWAGVAGDELYLRWFQAGMYLPYASAHGEGDHTVFGRPQAIIDLCRAALERRYRLLPYLYSLHIDAHRTGVPMIRSVAFETSGEPGSEAIDDQWFVGPWLMVAPVVEPASPDASATQRDVVLPTGEWLDLGDGITVHTGPTTLRGYPAPLDVVPTFARAGAIIPLGPPLRYALEPPPANHALTLLIVPSQAASTASLSEDDGEHGVEAGRASTRTIRVVRDAGATTITLDPRLDTGGFTPPARALELLVYRQVAAPAHVARDGADLPGRTAAELDAGAGGWAYDPALQQVRIRVAEDADGMTFTIA